MINENIATTRDLPPASIGQILLFMTATITLALRMLWTQRHNPNSRRAHLPRHSPLAVGLRDARSVGQLRRRLDEERRCD